jgi:hypothetical protein
MANEPDRPTVDWNRPNAEPQRPTTTWRRSDTTPTPGKPDTSRHPGRQVSRLAHLLATHAQNTFTAQKDSFTPEGEQQGLGFYRESRDFKKKMGYDDLGETFIEPAIRASFKNRHNKDYSYAELYGPDVHPDKYFSSEFTFKP